MVRALASRIVDRGFRCHLDQNKDYETDTVKLVLPESPWEQPLCLE